MSGICALVVTYHPTPEVAENIVTIRRQVDRVVVVDNAATPASRALLVRRDGDSAVQVLHYEVNLGLAAGLNRAARLAAEHGCEWLVTLDQDSRVPPGFVAELVAASAAWPATARVGIVAPVYRDRHMGFVYSPDRRFRADAPAVRLVDVALTSGNLVRARAHADAGGFREDFFIDCVDFEFCLRLRSRGWQIVEARAAVLDHAQGVWEPRRLLGRTYQFNDYSVERRYYQVRNRLVLWGRWGATSPRWVLRDLWGYPKEIVKLLLWGRDRRPKLRAMLHGARDAVLARMGPRA